MVICPDCRHVHTNQDLLATEVLCVMCTRKRIVARYWEQGFHCVEDWEVHTYREHDVPARQERRKGAGWVINLWVLPGWTREARALAYVLWPLQGPGGCLFSEHAEGHRSIIRLAVREGGHIVDALETLNQEQGDEAVRDYIDAALRQQEPAA